MAINTPTILHKVFTIDNINKSHIPLIFDLDRATILVEEPFLPHYEAYDGLDHIDASYDEPTTKPTTTEWKKVDIAVKMWIFTTLSQPLLASVDDSSKRWLCS
ncbi:hypothetical protein LXL04_037585 [Taraxacum kok-saghyz]